jgi:hypothetical protein
MEEDPEIRPPEISEDSEPHLGTTAVDHMVDPASPPDDEGLVPPSSIRLDNSKMNINEKDHNDDLSHRYTEVLNSLNTLSLNNNSEYNRSGGNENFYTAVYSIDPIEEESI